MKVVKEMLEDNKVRLDIEVDKADVNEAFNEAYKTVVKDVKLPGFRQGRVPKPVLEARFGKDVFLKDAIDIILNKVIPRTLSQEKIEPIDQVVLNDIYMEENEVAKIEVSVEVVPKAQLGKYSGLAIEKESSHVDEEQVLKALDTVREQYATLIVSQHETVEDGDFVVIDFEGFLNDEPFAGGKGEDYTLGIGSNTFIPGFEEKIVGMKLDEERDISLTFPADYRNEELAGQDVVFKVKLLEIKERELPPLDDAFAKMLGEFETLEELKDEARKNLEAEAQDKANLKFESEVLNAIAEDMTIDIPEKMIKERLDTIFKETAAAYSRSGIKLESYLEQMGSSIEEWRSNYRPVAEKQVRNHILLNAVIKAEGIEIGEEEFNAKIMEYAKCDEEALANVKEYLETNNSRGEFELTILREKALDFLLENNRKEEE